MKVIDLKKELNKFNDNADIEISVIGKNYNFYYVSEFYIDNHQNEKDKVIIHGYMPKKKTKNKLKEKEGNK